VTEGAAMGPVRVVVKEGKREYPHVPCLNAPLCPRLVNRPGRRCRACAARHRGRVRYLSPEDRRAVYRLALDGRVPRQVIARRYHISEGTVWRIVRERGAVVARRLTPYDIQRVWQALSLGASQAAAGRLVGVARQSISVAARRGGPAVLVRRCTGCHLVLAVGHFYLYRKSGRLDSRCKWCRRRRSRAASPEPRSWIRPPRTADGSRAAVARRRRVALARLAAPGSGATPAEAALALARLAALPRAPRKPRPDTRRSRLRRAGLVR